MDASNSAPAAPRCAASPAPWTPAPLERFVCGKWDEDIVPQLVEYIRIPNKSPMFDADWVSARPHGRGGRADGDWARAQPIPGMTVEVVRLEGRTPLIFIEIPATDGARGDDCVLLYGHLDKQPEMTGWDEGLGPVGAGAQGRPALRPRRRRRRLRDLRLAGRDPGAAGAGRAARALRGPDRGLRGIRQLRPARLRRPPRRPHRQAVAGGVPGFGLRQLRPAVVHDLAARPGRRQPDGPGARGRRALGRCLRHRAVELPPAARSCCRASRTRPPAAS